MALAPRKAKELAKLLEQDPQLKSELYDLIAKTDMAMRDGLHKAVLNSLKRRQIDVRMMDHGDVTDGLRKFYKAISLSGKFVKTF